MKRIIIILSAIVLLAACQKENRIQEPELSTVTYSVTAPVEFETKAAGDADLINVLWYGVYHKKENGEFKYMSDMSAFVDVIHPSSIQVPITLINNQVYKLVFVAQHKITLPQEEYVYNISHDDGIMTLNTDANITNGEQLDAFVYVEKEIGPIVGNENRNITLQRPVAQLNFATSKTVSANTPLSITLEGAPASYNVFTNTYSQQLAGPVTFAGLKVTGDGFTVSSNAYTRLETLYVLGGNKVEATVVTGTDGAATTTAISEIVTAPNYKTNIVGEI